MPDDSVQTDFDFTEFKESVIRIVAGFREELIFEDDQVRPLSVEDFIVDKLQGNDAAFAERKHVLTGHQFSAAFRRPKHNPGKLILALPAAGSDLIRNNPVDEWRRLLRFRLLIRN